MTSPLPVTKLYAPTPLPGAVPRPRLLQRLEAGLAGRLTLVCAPAGYGKSTLLGEWLQACERPGAWLQLDEGERDADQFVASLTAALRAVSPELGADALALAQARPRPSPQAVLGHLVNRLAQRRSPLLLVLDDLHLASSAEADAALAWLIEHLPAQLHLVLATRQQPALALARLRAQGQLLELGPDDLRFQPEEAEALLNRSQCLGLSAPQVQALQAHTEGWPAGLQMAAASLAGRADAEGFIRAFSGSHRAVQDYLLEEVLLRQPATLQDFLLRSSVLDALCPELCDAVLLRTDSQAQLQALAQRQLFTVPLDEERRWFRYHHLLGELLQQRLRQRDPGAPAALHQRASDWHQAQGRVRQALQHAVAAGDTGRALQVVRGRGVPLYFLEDAEPVLQWLQGRPPGYLDAHPPLWLMLAWSCLATSQHSRMPMALQGAAAAIARHAGHPGHAAWLAEWHAVSAWEAVSRCDVATLQREAEAALAGLAALEAMDAARATASVAVLRCTARCAQGVAHQFRGERAAAQQVYAQVLPLAEACGNRMFAIVAGIALGHLQEDELHLHLAARTYGRALALLGDQPHAVACELHLGLARIHWAWNDPAAAHHHAMHSSALGALLECDSALGADALRARLLLAVGEVEPALALLAQATRAAQTRNAQGGRQAIAQAQVQALLQTGEVMAAGQRAQDQALPLDQAWVLLARGQALQAHEALSAVLAAPTEALPAAERLRALLLQALALDALQPGPADATLTLLDQALALAEPQGCVRAFVDLGGPMERLLGQAAQGTRPRFAAQLLEALQAQRQSLARAPGAQMEGPAAAAAAPGSAPGATAGAAVGALAEPLSARELAVLALICKGLSNQEIARQLHVSLSTVKWHNQNIFDKLDVQRRTEAVARAQALKLL